MLKKRTPMDGSGRIMSSSHLGDRGDPPSTSASGFKSPVSLALRVNGTLLPFLCPTEVQVRVWIEVKGLGEPEPFTLCPVDDQVQVWDQGSGILDGTT